MLTQVTATFTLESLVAVDETAIKERLEMVLEPEDSDNWFDDCDQYAILQSDSLTVELAHED